MKKKIQLIENRKEVYPFFSKPQIYEQIYLSNNTNEALNYLMIDIKEMLKTKEVFLYSRFQKRHSILNNLLKKILSHKLIIKLTKILEKESLINLLKLINNIRIPKSVNSIIVTSLKIDSRILGMLFIFNSPCTKDNIIEISSYASFFYNLILKKKYHNNNYYSKLYNHLDRPVYFGEFLVDHKVQFLKGDSELYGLLNHNIFSIFDYNDIKFLLKLKEKARNRESIKVTIKVKNLHKQYRWFEVYGSWVNTIKNKPVYLCIFQEITKEVKLANLLALMEKRFDFVVKDQEGIIFEYDINNDIYSTYNLKTKSHSIKNNYLSTFKKKYPQLNPNQAKWVTLLSGNELGLVKLQKTNEENNKWIAIESELIKFGEFERKIIGKITDITKEKEEEEKLIKESRLDKITQIYNRITGEYLIRKELTSNNKNSLIIIDIDNFSEINKKFGYTFGNEVLRTFAEYLERKLPARHILYRHSVDHFIALLCGVDCAKARDIANNICKEAKEGNIISEIDFSCSVGIVGTHLSDNLNELIKCADCALVNIKNGGKGFAANYFYIEDSLKTVIHSKHLGKKHNQNIDFEDDVLSFTFEILKKSNDVSKALNLLFPILARKLNISKIYILDIDIERLEANITHHYGNIDTKAFVICESDYYIFKSGFNINGVYLDAPYIATNELSLLISEASLIISLYEHHNHFGSIFFMQEKLGNESILKLVSNSISIFLIQDFKKTEISNRMKLLTRLSHEIRTPLNGIKGMIRIAQNEINDRKKLINALDKMTMSTKYLLSLVNNILDLSRIETGKMKIINEPFNVHTLVNDLYILIRIQAEDKNIDFKIVKNCKDEFILGDSIRLSQVLINIIGNAIKFTQENGEVIFRVDEIENDSNNTVLRFSVKDNGVGINAENINRIFNAYEQENTHVIKSYGGTGLGLAISKSLVNMMGGNIEVKSKVNEGSEFFFTLTLSKATSLKQENWELKFSDKRILVAEDNPLNLKIITSFLDEFDCSYEIARNGQEVIDKYNENESYYYDLILMDIRMPIVDGFKATKYIRSSGKDDALLIPIIAMTANAYTEEEQASIECGMNAHLIKPIDINLLYKELLLFLK